MTLSLQKKKKDRKPIREIDQEMKILFDESAKGFSTVKSVFEFMRCCKLAELVKTYGKEPTKAAAAWTLVNNSILLNRRANITLSMTVLNKAIKLAQTHLEQMDEDADEPVLKVQE